MATLFPPRSSQLDDPRLPLAIELLPMRRRHIPQVLDIERRVYPRPWTMTLFLSEIVQRSNRFYIVARAHRRVVGYAGLMVFGDEAHVTNIAVDPDAHRRKVAARLLYALITEARRRPDRDLDRSRKAFRACWYWASRRRATRRASPWWRTARRCAPT